LSIRRWVSAAVIATAIVCCGGAEATSPTVFGAGMASPDARRLAGWITENGDNGGLPFVIIDKTAARVFVADPQGQVLGTASALLGVAIGDASPPGIGDKPLSEITPELRITPAGRFPASLGEDLAGKTVLWVDYAAALSLHTVVTGKPAEHRLQRLASPSVLDKRISYGCINVPPEFFQAIVLPLFKRAGGIVYILPETRSIEAVFFHASAADPGVLAKH